MTSAPLSFATCEAAFTLSPIPVWVLDLDTIRVYWANEAALALWQAKDHDELRARDVTTGVPPKVAQRVQATIAQVREGKVLCEDWTFHPQGRPTMVVLHHRAILLEDGRIGMLNQALPVGSETPPSLLRAVTALRYTSVIVVFVSSKGEILMQNDAAISTFGGEPSWQSWFVERDAGDAILSAALAGKAVRIEAEVGTVEGPRRHAIEANILMDPVTGEAGVLINQKDETARITAESTAAVQGQYIVELREALATVEQQRLEILALSAPLLDVGDDTLAIPIIGHLSRERSQEIVARLLDAVVERRARHVLLDLTGVAALDEPGAEQLRAMIEALRLLGTTPIVCGIRPDVARALIDSGCRLEGMVIRRSLADGLARRAREKAYRPI